MHLSLFGTRGSIATPDADKLRHGGNTSCVSVELDDGQLILDAGTGIRNLGAQLYGSSRPLHILLTHLHLDHIQGLLFFAPFFDPTADVTVWGPRGAVRGLRQRLARYLSSPLSPIEMRELPARVAFREVPAEPWSLLGAQISAGLVTHRGPTLGYRISQRGKSICYLPDHEPGLGQDVERDPGDWISGFALAHGVDLLVHDGQYTGQEYLSTRGWGHCAVPDALRFARRAQVSRLVLFHHDPAHDDAALDVLGAEARSAWTDQGGEARQVVMAVEGQRFST